MANNPNDLTDFESYTEEDDTSYGDDTPQIVESGGEALRFEEEVVITKITS